MAASIPNGTNFDDVIGVALAKRGIAPVFRPLDVIIAQEGELLTSYSEGSANILTSTNSATPVQVVNNLDNTTAGGASLGGQGAGRMLWVEAITIGFLGLPSGTTISFQLGGWGDADGKFPQFIYRGTYSAGGSPVTIPLRRLFRPSRTDKSALVATIRNVIPAVGATTSVTTVCSMIGAELTDDPNFNAAKTMAVFSDSLDYGKGYGPTYSQDIYSFKLRDYYRSLGHDIRLVSFAQPGRTSTMFENADRASGKLDFLRPSLGMYALGTNDAILAATNFDTTWEANFLKFWNWWRLAFPKSPLLVRNVGPLNDAAYHANAQTLRTKQAAVVTAINSPLCKLVDVSSAFTRTDASFYRASDPVHWNTAGHAAVALVVQAYVAANNIAAA